LFDRKEMLKRTENDVSWLVTRRTSVNWRTAFSSSYPLDVHKKCGVIDANNRRQQRE
jgi:hypothetical protein